MRNTELKSAGISKWRYAELRAYCRQYDEMRKEKRTEDCVRIEQAAVDADAVRYMPLMKNVTQGIRYEETGYYGSRSDFFRARGKFFKRLDEMMRGRDEGKEE